MRTNREETTPGLLLINATTVERSSSKTFLICLEKCPKIYKVDVFIVATIIYFVWLESTLQKGFLSLLSEVV